MTTTFSTVDVAQKAVAKDLIDILKQNLILYRTAKIQKLNQGANSKTVIFRGFNKLALASALTEGVVPSGQTLSMNSVTVVLTQYGDFTRITDVAEFLYDRSLVQDATDVLGIQATETIENAIVNVIGAGTTVVYGDGSVTTRATVTSTMTFTTTLIKRSVRWLERNNVKKFPKMPVIGDGYVTLIHPDVAADVRGDTNFVAAVNYSSPSPEGRGASARGDLFSGELGFWLGTRLISSTVAPIYKSAGSSSVDIYGCLTYGDGAYGVSELAGGISTYIHSGGQQDTFNPLEQYATIGWKWMGAAAILDNNRIIRNEVGATLTGTTA